MNNLHRISNAYYLLKGVLLYRLVFKKFGQGSLIRDPLLILSANFITIGNNVRIREGIRLEMIQSSPGREPELVIGDDTNIEQNVHIVCHSRIHIGRGVSITGNCSIVDVTHPFEDVSSLVKIGSRIKDENSFVEIGDGSFIGMGSAILPNVRLGKHSIIGANSVVTSDIPEYSVAAGAPAKILKRYDAESGLWIRVRRANS